jgi:hypothetical protein
MTGVGQESGYGHAGGGGGQAGQDMTKSGRSGKGEIFGNPTKNNGTIP